MVQKRNLWGAPLVHMPGGAKREDPRALGAFGGGRHRHGAGEHGTGTRRTSHGGSGGPSVRRDDLGVC